MAIEIGSTVEGTVVKLAEYGAIVRLAGGNMGLVHISEVADAFVRDIRDYFRENDRIAVKVLRMNNKGRYELSVKQADPAAVRRSTSTEEMQAAAENSKSGEESAVSSRRHPATFEERLSRFMRSSEERLLDLKRSVERKRGGGRR